MRGAARGHAAGHVPPAPVMQAAADQRSPRPWRPTGDVGRTTLPPRAPPMLRLPTILVTLAASAIVGCGHHASTLASDVEATPARTPPPSDPPAPPVPSDGHRHPASFASLRALTLEHGQGGPSTMRCDGTSWRVAIDLRANTWTYGACPPGTPRAPTPPHAPLTTRHGVLGAQDRVRIAAEYDALWIDPSPSCAYDGGPNTLILTGADGTKATYLDHNWGCHLPTPTIVRGLGRFASNVTRIAQPPPTP